MLLVLIKKECMTRSQVSNWMLSNDMFIMDVNNVRNQSKTVNISIHLIELTRLIKFFVIIL